MKLLLLNGSSCVGKSTIINGLMKKEDRYFKLSYDSIKRLFSKYDRDAQWEDVNYLLGILCSSVVEMKYNILCDTALFPERRKIFMDLAKQHNYEVVEINLEAEYEVLAKRFDERVANSVNAIVKPNNLSKERFKELYDIYQENKNPHATTFRTDVLSTEEVEGEILKLLRN